jgi:uncharacterized protein (DUF2252 family)
MTPALKSKLAEGRLLRAKTPRAEHGRWTPPANRRDPVDLLAESNRGRLPNLLPIRHERMAESPFAFYRGSALLMAADLAQTPASGLRVHACGDCHLMNFGGFATPERNLIFDINDFDESLPGPWEWDVKRLAASFAVASRQFGFSRSISRDIAATAVRSYRERMHEFAAMRSVDVWYTRITAERLIALSPGKQDRRQREAVVESLRNRSTHAMLPKTIVRTKQGFRIKNQPPLVEQLPPRHPTLAAVRKTFAHYVQTLPDERRVLIDRYRAVDIARRVVGVGSVGLRGFMILMEAGPDDVLLLQVKEARPSVLEPYAGKSPWPNEGQRVVSSQRLIQAASDIFLGWGTDPSGRHFYFRQLRDMKLSPVVDDLGERQIDEYASLCGWVLARAHARTGDAPHIAGYLGNSGRFDDAVARFALDYEKQNEKDYDSFVRSRKRI